MNWHFEERKIRSLKRHPKNPRQLSKHDAKHLQDSVERFGLCEPIVITHEGTIIGGHQRVRILKKLGHKTATVAVCDETLTDEQIDELNIRLNRNAGEWDFDILANEWEIDDLVDWGFKSEEFAMGTEVIEGTEEDLEKGLLKPPEEPKTMAGDLYQIGEHRLLCGDSTLPDAVHRLLGDVEPVLMVTDPPYGVEYDPSWRSVAGKGQKSAGKVQNDDKINWAVAWSLFPGNVAYVWHAANHCSEVQKSLEDANFEIVSQIIWAKQHFALSRGDYHWQHEPCWYAVRKGQSHNWQGSRKESTLWEIGNLNAFGKSDQEDQRTSHSTQKPLRCMEGPIKNNSCKGDAVYEPFAGSGTTLIAAEKLGRIAYCMELDPAYCDVIVDRYIKFCAANDQECTILKNGEPFEKN